ncbi:glycogen synthase GlgA [Leucothrix arctica]|uniref:Glycogen synthase n=1 Tax=Leucothrix arctica TaxID=1481894 RepID=A0A317C4E8_9GAMM|nr:glycogen synthase GlgA [Leucothrix arctica]PWQ93458.1 glycogen synthase GlgA [Leucothrix arctica]
MNVLFASSEVWPLIKTGGLGDVSYSLPHALQNEGQNVRIIMPAYRDVLKVCTDLKILGWMDSPYGYMKPAIRLLEAKHPDIKIPLWLIDCQSLFDRPGNPYSNTEGHDWFDNAERFTQFSWAVSEVAMGHVVDDWKADVVHANDWQTGLVSAFLDNYADRPKRIFTIHNLAYSGNYSRQIFDDLGLPKQWWSSEGVEFYGGFSMLKAGLIYSDAITTVSPTYAKEIRTSEFGHGLEGILSSRSYKLSGILNGIDDEVWNPEKDPYIANNYSLETIEEGKLNNKRALLEKYVDEPTEAMLAAPLLGMVTRLVEQKGVDLITQAIPSLISESDANFILMGSGNPYYERVIHELCEHYPDRVFSYIGYSEPIAHLVEAASDIFLMPSRFEPCGLNQMYSLRYGTLPLVHNTGGLADTVVNASAEAINDKTANGFVMYSADTAAFISTIKHALYLYQDPTQWKALQTTAMQEDFAWRHSAQLYLSLYK